MVFEKRMLSKYDVSDCVLFYRCFGDQMKEDESGACDTQVAKCVQNFGEKT
jgi:hypothetical protein